MRRKLGVLKGVKRAVRRLLQSLSSLPARPSGLRLRVERVTGIEPAWPAWKAGALPLSYTRETVGGNAPLAPTSPADQDPRVAVRVERSAWPIRRVAQARRGWWEVARRVPKSGCCDVDAWTDEHPRKALIRPTERGHRLLAGPDEEGHLAEE